MMSKLLVVLAGLSIASLAHAYVPNIQQACAAVPLCDSVSVTKSPDHELWPHAWLVSCKKNVPGKTPKYDESLFSNTLLLTHHLFIWNGRFNKATRKDYVDQGNDPTGTATKVISDYCQSLYN